MLVDGFASLCQFRLPRCLGTFEPGYQFVFLVAISGGALIVGARHCFRLIGLRLGNEFLQVVDFLRHLHVVDVRARTCLVECVDGFVGELTVGYISVGERHAGFYGFVGVAHAVMLLVFALDVVQYGKRFVGRGRLHDNLLETAFESAIFFDVLAILVECGGTDALYLAAGESRLEQVGGIHRARSVSGTHNGVNLVDEENYVGVLRQFVNHSLDALFKLPAIFGAGNQRRHVEREYALVEQCASHVAVHDSDGKCFNDSRFAHTGFANEHWIVLFATAENLRQTFNLLVATHHGVEAVVFGFFGDVLAVFVQHRRVAGFAHRGAAGSALAAAGLFRAAAGRQVVLLIFVVFGKVGPACRLPLPVEHIFFYVFVVQIHLLLLFGLKK